MKSLVRLGAALRFWQSRYDTLAMEVDHLVQRHGALQRMRDDRRGELAERHESVVGAATSVGDSLLTLHMHIVASGQYEHRTAAQQQVVAQQIEEKRGQMMALKRKLKQVETIKTGAERAQTVAVERRLDEEAAYLFLTRNRAE